MQGAEREERMQGIARPKNYGMFTISTFTGEAKCYIHCFPQQKWKYKLDDKSVDLEYKNLSMIIPKVDFEKYFKVVE